MARSDDLHSAGAQFFINLKDVPPYDKKQSPYCVFGKVVENLWALYEMRQDDKILDAWVVRKRSDKPDAYTPSVKNSGESTYGPPKKKEQTTEK